MCTITSAEPAHTEPVWFERAHAPRDGDRWLASVVLAPGEGPERASMPDGFSVALMLAVVCRAQPMFEVRRGDSWVPFHAWRAGHGLGSLSLPQQLAPQWVLQGLEPQDGAPAPSVRPDTLITAHGYPGLLLSRGEPVAWPVVAVRDPAVELPGLRGDGMAVIVHDDSILITSPLSPESLQLLMDIPSSAAVSGRGTW